jgi:hypothetical protein
MTFEGFTFSSTGTVTASGKVDRPELDMDLNDIVKRNRQQQGANRRPNSTPRKNQPGQRSGGQATNSPKKGGQQSQQKTNAPSPKSGGKRTYDINVPASALKQILQGAGVTLPDDVELKLVATRRPN